MKGEKGRGWAPERFHAGLRGVLKQARGRYRQAQAGKEAGKEAGAERQREEERRSTSNSSGKLDSIQLFLLCSR